MKTTQTSIVQLIATDSVSIWDWKDEVRVTFRESADSSVEVSGVITVEFLRACIYFIDSLSKMKGLCNNKQRLLNSLLEDLKVMETNQTKVEA